MPPTYSPAPTWKGGCDDPHNFFLDRCVRKRYKPKPSAVAWDALGTVGQVSVMLVIFMAVTLSVSIFLARARKKRRRNESYFNFFLRDLVHRRKKKKKRRKVAQGLDESMLGDTASRRSTRSGRRSVRSRSKRRRRSTSTRGRRSVGGALQPGRSSRSRDRRRASSATRGGGDAFDITVQTPRGSESKDNRQQLV